MSVALGAWMSVRDRAGWIRSALAALGVAVALLTVLAAAAGAHVVTGSAERAFARTPTAVDDPSARLALLTRTDDDVWDGRHITRILVATQAGRLPAPPPGLLKLPNPGTCVVSPALRRVLGRPDAQSLRARYCGNNDAWP